MEGVRNLSIAVKKHGDSIRFLRKIVPGGVDDSYGIDVAKLAGLPPRVVTRAKELLKELESQAPVRQEQLLQDGQISFAAVSRDQIADRLRKTHLDELSDRECRELLEDLVQLAQA